MFSLGHLHHQITVDSGATIVFGTTDITRYESDFTLKSAIIVFRRLENARPCYLMGTYLGGPHKVEFPVADISDVRLKYLTALESQTTKSN